MIVSGLRLDRARVRAHVVDANDGIIATAGVVEGLVGAGVGTGTVIVASLAAMVGGGLALGGMKYSEAADERDARIATIEAERRQLDLSPDEELAELTGIYEAKGLSPELARAVARELSERDALAAHAEAEHGIAIEEAMGAVWPTAVLAALAFTIGSAVPLLVVVLTPPALRGAVTFVAVALALGLTSFVVAALGGTSVWRTVARTVAIGVATMLLTLLGGNLLGV